MGVIEFLFALAQDMILPPFQRSALRWCSTFPCGRYVVCAAWRDWPWFTNDLNDQRLNIEWSTFMASMLVGTIGIHGRAGIWRIRKCLPWRPLSLFPGHIGLYRNDFGGKNQPVRYSEPLMITLLTNFLTASSIVVRYPSVFPFLDYGCTASALGIKLPRLSTRMRDSLLSSVCTIKVISLLVHRSIFEKQYVFRVLTPDVVGIDALVHDHQTVWQKLKAVWLPYLLTMPRRFCRHACTSG